MSSVLMAMSTFKVYIMGMCLKTTLKSFQGDIQTYHHDAGLPASPERLIFRPITMMEAPMTAQTFHRMRTSCLVAGEGYVQLGPKTCSAHT